MPRGVQDILLGRKEQGSCTKASRKEGSHEETEALFCHLLGSDFWDTPSEDNVLKDAMAAIRQRIAARKCAGSTAPRHGVAHAQNTQTHIESAHTHTQTQPQQVATGLGNAVGTCWHVCTAFHSTSLPVATVWFMPAQAVNGSRQRQLQNWACGQLHDGCIFAGQR